jgi:hypothetical protein
MAKDAATDPVYAHWIKEIEAYERLTVKWRPRVRMIIARYKDDRNGDSNGDDVKARRYNVLWSNVETLKPLLYSATPEPVVSRRFLDKDPCANTAALVLKRALQWSLEQHYFGSTMRQAVLDYLLGGRGTVWARYAPQIVPDPTVATEEKPEGIQGTDDAGTGATGEMVAFEEAMPDFVHWEDFGHSYGRVWEEVTAGWRWVNMTRAQLVEKFGEELGKAIPLDATARPKGEAGDTRNDDQRGSIDRARICEIWDKEKQQVLFLSRGYPKILAAVPDPLGLPQFFPFPRPLYATLANDSLVPVPDYALYQDQALEIDDLTGRIAGITKAIKAVGVYDGSVKELERIFTEGTDNKLIPVENWAALSEKGGLPGAIQLVPMQEIAQTLLALYEARDKVKADLYEITGMSDIIRGNSDPRETATAQRGKIKFASMRLDERQREVARFARNVVVIIGNIIASKFGQDTLAQITGVKLFATEEEKAAYQPPQMGHNGGPPMDGQMPPMAAPMAPVAPPPPPPGWTEDDVQDALNKPCWADVMALLQSNALRSFRLDIETDSTVANDQEADKQEANEFITALGGFLGQAAKAPPAMAPLIAEMLKFAIRRYPVGSDLEDKLDGLIDDMVNQAQQPPPPPPPDPSIAVDQARIQLDGQKALGEHDMAQKTHDLAAKKAADDHAFRMAQLEQGHQKAMAELALKHKQVELQAAEMGRAAAHEEATNTIQALKVAVDHHAKERDRAHAEAEAHRNRAAQAQEQAESAKTKATEVEGSASDKMADALATITKLMTAPREIVRDKDGRALGVRAKLDSEA